MSTATADALPAADAVLVNDASVTSATADSNPTNNEDTAAILVTRSADLDLGVIDWTRDMPPAHFPKYEGREGLAADEVDDVDIGAGHSRRLGDRPGERGRQAVQDAPNGRTR